MPSPTVDTGRRGTSEMSPPGRAVVPDRACRRAW
jgi:hypothetical protein